MLFQRHHLGSSDHLPAAVWCLLPAHAEVPRSARAFSVPRRDTNNTTLIRHQSCGHGSWRRRRLQLGLAQLQSLLQLRADPRWRRQTRFRRHVWEFRYSESVALFSDSSQYVFNAQFATPANYRGRAGQAKWRTKRGRFRRSTRGPP
uniref:Putative secreted protein n=1 Tax=Ixodes ricinus TaxID=34613 RepID=A0A6B0UUX8_IXORI